LSIQLRDKLRYTSAPLRGADAVLRHLGKPVLTVLRWQLAASAVLALIGWLVAGGHGAASAAAGGLVSIVAGLASAWVASRSNTQSAGGVLLGALRAEAIKIGLALMLLWLVLANYGEAVVGALLGAFVVTMLIFSMAFFVRDY
jgi:ATP synthase protein I